MTLQPYFIDNQLQGTNNLSCGANEEEYHYTGLCMERDVVDAEYVDLAKIVDGGICPHCGKKTIHISRGIEVGNIFQLGTKYTKTMNMTYVDKDGTSKNPIMVATVSVSDVWQLPSVKHIMMIMVQSGQ